MFRVNLRCFLVLVMAAVISSKSEWDYDGPLSWHLTYPTCGSNSQSPIDINSDRAQYTKSLNDFSFEKYDSVQSWNLTFDEHGGVVVIPESDAEISISGGGLGDEFHLSNLHFHWNEGSGSEHMLNGNSYAAEMHLVHTSDSRQNAILGFFLEARDHYSDYDNPSIAPIIETISKLSNVSNTGTMSFSIMKSILGLQNMNHLNDMGFYRYQVFIGSTGSLTTPPCTEGKIWTIFSHNVKISVSQMNALRKNKPARNSRPVQSLNGRVVYTNIPKTSGGEVCDCSTIKLALVVVLGLVLFKRL